MIDLAHLPDLDALPDGELLALLDRVAADLEATIQREAALYELRLAVYKAARTREPAITQARLAEAARVTEVAVIQTLRADRKKNEAMGEHEAGAHGDGAVRGCPTCALAKRA